MQGAQLMWALVGWIESVPAMAGITMLVLGQRGGWDWRSDQCPWVVLEAGKSTERCSPLRTRLSMSLGLYLLQELHI